MQEHSFDRRCRQQPVCGRRDAGRQRERERIPEAAADEKPMKVWADGVQVPFSRRQHPPQLMPPSRLPPRHKDNQRRDLTLTHARFVLLLFLSLSRLSFLPFFLSCCPCATESRSSRSPCPSHFVSLSLILSRSSCRAPQPSLYLPPPPPLALPRPSLASLAPDVRFPSSLFLFPSFAPSHMAMIIR